MNPNEILLLVSASIGLPTISAALINAYLNRKNANKQLESSTLTDEINEFNTHKESYAALLEEYKTSADRANLRSDKANAATDVALAQLEILRKERSSLYDFLEEQTRKIEIVRDLLEAYVRRVGIKMSPEEQKAFEDTKPRRVWDINNKGRNPDD